MKNCPSCGAVCNDNEKFCGSCGHSFLDVDINASKDQPNAPAEDAYPGYGQPAPYAPKVATKKEFLKLPENKKLRSELNGAAIVAFVCAGINVILGAVTGNWGVMLDVAIMVGLGLGIMLFSSRVCAILLLAYGLLNVVMGLVQNGTPSGYLILIAGVLAVIYAFKAEKAWKQYQQSP